jgi:hypothetical protein
MAVCQLPVCETGRQTAPGSAPVCQTDAREGKPAHADSPAAAYALALEAGTRRRNHKYAISDHF